MRGTAWAVAASRGPCRVTTDYPGGYPEKCYVWRAWWGSNYPHQTKHRKDPQGDQGRKPAGVRSARKTRFELPSLGMMPGVPWTPGQTGALLQIPQGSTASRERLPPVKRPYPRHERRHFRRSPAVNPLPHKAACIQGTVRWHAVLDLDLASNRLETWRQRHDSGRNPYWTRLSGSPRRLETAALCLETWRQCACIVTDIDLITKANRPIPMLERS
jgi:hypothetical protein